MSSLVFSPKVSVIIPCFNGSKTLGRAIESVLAQTTKELELIIVDD
ncbi:MAG: glycosyltransferase, partial [Syntrophorhabdales bacterium]